MVVSVSLLLEQEQRDACVTYQEVLLRLRILQKLNSRSYTTPESNGNAVDDIKELIQRDVYFSSPDAELDADYIQIIGYMGSCRENFSMLDSVESVPD